MVEETPVVVAAVSFTGRSVGVGGTVIGSILAGGVVASSVPSSTKETSLLPVDGVSAFAILWAFALLRVTLGALLVRGCRESYSGTIFLPKVDSLTKKDAAIDSIRGLSPPSDV